MLRSSKPTDRSFSTGKVRHPLAWVPTAYIAEGIPFAMIIWVAGTMFKDLGHSDTEITVAVASIGIAWSLKPLWAGFLDMFRTKKFFVLSMEFVMAVLFGCMALALNLDSYFTSIIALMWVLAFASATQDICVDGVYINSLREKQQAAFIGVQSMAWNLGRLIAVSFTVWLAGYLQTEHGVETRSSWSLVLGCTALLMGTFGLYHLAVLPTGGGPQNGDARSAGKVVREFLTSAADFCDKPGLWGMLAFVFFYRSAEGLLLVEAPLFMQGCLEDGGLQLSLQDKGAIDGSISTIANVSGGLLGGLLISRLTLKRTLFFLALCVNIPNACYIYLAYAVSPENPLSFGEIAFVVSMEKFWYGLGFVGNMLYMMQQLAPGRFKMTHYAFATALMNLVLVPTQMVSGPLADLLGFREYFWIVMVAAGPSLVAAWLAPFPLRGDGVPDTADAEDLEDLEVRARSRRATIYAMLSIVLFLYVDILSLGWLSGASDGLWLATLLAVLAASTALKVYLGIQAIRTGRSAAYFSRQTGRGRAFAANGTGAVVAGVAMLMVSVALGVFGVHKVRSVDWDCAFQPDPTRCQTQAPPKTRQCLRESVDR